MKTIIFICNLSIIFSTTPFKGYIKHSGYSRSSYIYPYFYAEGQYLNGLMDGEWNFYSDSTKQYVVAKGGFLNGNTSNPSKYGIPKNGRHGLWEHYYTENERWRKNSPTLKNPLRSIQYWNNGKLTGKSTSYFQDGKIAVECNYKDGKKHGNRKEWYEGGYMYSKLYRNTEYSKGTPTSDKIYNYATTSVSIISSYLNDIRIDTVFSSNHQKKLFVRKMKDGYYHGKFFAYHINGSIWIEGNFKNGWRDGEWKEFSEDGKFIAKIDYEGGVAITPDNYNQKIYNLDGKLIYSYQLTKGVKNGEAVECLYGISDIIHKPQIHRYSYSQKNWYEHNQKFEDQKLRPYKNYQVNQLIPNLNPYFKKPQYQIRHVRFTGFNQNSMKEHIMTMSKIVGSGYYKNNIRVGKWIWKTINDNKIVLEGEYSEEGLPIGEWIEVNTNDDDDSIITQYDKNGKVESISKKSKNYFK